MNELITHDQLLSVCIYLPDDYTPYGSLQRWEHEEQGYPDCSCGCRWYVKLAGELGDDWGVCTNPRSHRTGLLTFEHQGCLQFESDTEEAIGYANDGF
jgi:hypothetical protein